MFGMAESAGNAAAGISIQLGDVGGMYDSWEAPTVIVSDGAYGIKGFPGDPPTADGLAAWYEPHIAAWSRKATPQTTLWFWNSEVGWATVHPILQKYGWKYRSCHIWNKGMAHAAGNSNTKTLRKFPVVTEVCVQYDREAEFRVDGQPATMKAWLRDEWQRAGLPLSKTNEACGVKNAATRKYFTQDHLWYYPPPDMFAKFAAYANKHGEKSGRPYFSIDGKEPISEKDWAAMRTKFYCEVGITNVWDDPAVRNSERLKKDGTGLKCAHLNQKPLRLIERIIRASSDEGDLVWEPFGGLCTAAVAARKLKRRCNSAEVIKEYYDLAIERVHGKAARSPTDPDRTKFAQSAVAVA